MDDRPHHDVASTLGELERKLRELEQELENVGRNGSADTDPAQGGWPAPADPPPPGAIPLPETPPPAPSPYVAEWQGGSTPPPADPTLWGLPPTPEPPPPPTTAGVAEFMPYRTRPEHQHEEHAPEPPAAPAERAWSAEPPRDAAPSASEPSWSAQPPRHAAPSASEPSWSAEPPRQEPAAAPSFPVRPPLPPLAPTDLGGRLDELLRFREQLVSATNDLVHELSRVLADLGAEAPAQRPDPEAREYTGSVTVDVGPITELGRLAALEQALAAVPGVATAAVRTLQDGRAQLEVRLARPVALAVELRRHSPLPLGAVEPGEDRLAVTLEG